MGRVRLVSEPCRGSFGSPADRRGKLDSNSPQTKASSSSHNADQPRAKRCSRRWPDMMNLLRLMPGCGVGGATEGSTRSAP